jgi:hypothetical protein
MILKNKASFFSTGTKVNFRLLLRVRFRLSRRARQPVNAISLPMIFYRPSVALGQR